jgi:hypothetical protein
METVYFSKTLLSACDSIRRQEPEKQHYHPHRRENLKSHKVNCFACCVYKKTYVQLFTIFFFVFLVRKCFFLMDLVFSAIIELQMQANV